MTAKRGRGRPSTGIRVDIRIPEHQLKVIDWMADSLGRSRAEVIRDLIEIGLNTQP